MAENKDIQRIINAMKNRLARGEAIVDIIKVPDIKKAIRMYPEVKRFYNSEYSKYINRPEVMKSKAEKAYGSTSEYLRTVFRQSLEANPLQKVLNAAKKMNIPEEEARKAIKGLSKEKIIQAATEKRKVETEKSEKEYQEKRKKFKEKFFGDISVFLADLYLKKNKKEKKEKK